MSGRVLLVLLAAILATDANNSSESSSPRGNNNSASRAVTSLSTLLKASLDIQEDNAHTLESSKLDALKDTPLQKKWFFWKEVSADSPVNAAAAASKVDYLKTFERLEPFTKYGEFITSWEQLMDNYATRSDIHSLHLFRQGVRPAWEDKANKRGGRVILVLNRAGNDADQNAIEVFIKLCIAMISNKLGLLETSATICGCSLAFHATSLVLSIWNKNSGDAEEIAALISQMAALVSHRAQMSGDVIYKAHRLSMTRGHSNRSKNSNNKNTSQALKKNNNRTSPNTATGLLKATRSAPVTDNKSNAVNSVAPIPSSVPSNAMWKRSTSLAKREARRPSVIKTVAEPLVKSTESTLPVNEQQEEENEISSPSLSPSEDSSSSNSENDEEVIQLDYSELSLVEENNCISMDEPEQESEEMYFDGSGKRTVPSTSSTSSAVVVAVPSGWKGLVIGSFVPLVALSTIALTSVVSYCY